MIFKTRFLSFSVLMVMASLSNGKAQLSWGINGTGGGGTWDNTTADWYNGTSNVTWVSGDIATFAGSPGTVSIQVGQNVGGLVFNTAGYTVVGATLSATSAFTVQTNTTATVGTLDLLSTFTKSGSATLSLEGNFYQNSTGGIANITAGNLQILTPNSVGSSTVYNFSNVAGAALILNGGVGNTYAIAGLSVGGTTGGNVTVGAAAGTSTLQITGLAANSYAGIIQDNGSGKLALTVLNGYAQTFTGASTYSGATQNSGNLILSGNGSLLNTAITLAGLLTLDDTGTNNVNRVSNTTPFTFAGGTLIFNGQASASSAQSIGALTLASGYSTSEVNAGSGGSSVVTYNGVSRSVGGGTVDFLGTGSSAITGASNVNGILGAYAVYNGTDWATVNGQNKIVAYTGYATNLNTAPSTSNIKLTGSGTTTLTASSTINSLNLQNSTSSDQVLDLGGNTLSVSSGGVLTTSSTNSETIQNGNLTSSGGEIIFTNQSVNVPAEHVINANITDATSVPVSITVTGQGSLYLGGANTYSGATSIQGGTLVANSAAALPSTTVVNDMGNLTLINGATIAGLTGNGNLGITAGTLTVNTTANTTYAGHIAGAGGVTKEGSGTLALSGAATYTGATQISGGTLLLHEGTLSGGQATLASTTPVIFSGGTLAVDTPTVGGINQKFGTLTLQSSSTIDFTNNFQLTLSFADSSSITWAAGELTLENFNPSIDQLRFGTSSTGLTTAQLADIVFAGSSDYAGLDNNGFLVQEVPEPSVLKLFICSFLVLMFMARRRSIKGSVPRSETNPSPLGSFF